MTLPTVSVVVVSRGRPVALARCLTAVAQLRYPCFEIVVVADTPAMAEIRQMDLFDGLKAVEFDDANISVARNHGIRVSAGEIIAFIDDDSVPEPSWLSHLASPFEHANVVAAGGFVRGRNGISYQWKAQSIGEDGFATDLDVESDCPVVLTPTGSAGIKTQGTNMAFRRSVLAKLGGFDSSFHYFHEETDMNIRLAKGGYLTAIVPLAEVHHGYASNPGRAPNRVPTDLFQVGASWAVFLRKHCPETRRERIWQDVQKGEKRRALRHLVSGGMEPRDVTALMRSLRAGFVEGTGRDAVSLPPLSGTPPDFKPYRRENSRSSELICGRIWNARKLKRRARRMVRDGHVVTLILLSHTALFHRVQFHSDGYWVQRGGLFGRSDRDSRLVRAFSFRRRIRAERERVAVQRLF